MKKTTVCIFAFLVLLAGFVSGCGSIVVDGECLTNLDCYGGVCVDGFCVDIDASDDASDVLTDDAVDAEEQIDSVDTPEAEDSDNETIVDAPDTTDVIDVEDTPDTADTVDTSDVEDAPDTTDTTDTTDTIDVEDVPDTTDASDVLDTSDTTDAPDTCGSEGGWRDPVTGLCWEINGRSDTVIYEGAVEYCRTYHSGSRWRLPTVSELRTLIRGCPSTETGGSCTVTDTCVNPSCRNLPDCIGCGELLIGCYWPDELTGSCVVYATHSSTVAGGMRWLVAYGWGSIQYQPDIYDVLGYVRCVRD